MDPRGLANNGKRSPAIRAKGVDMDELCDLKGALVPIVAACL